MARALYRTIGLVSLLVFVGLAAEASPDKEPYPKGLSSSQIQAYVDGFDSFRSRLCTEFKTPRGPIRTYVDADFSQGGPSLSRVSIASPSFDFGPLRETGLMSALNHPAGTTSTRERSGVSSDQARDPGNLSGGVLRILDAGAPEVAVELSALVRGGLAPDGTRSGGLSLSTPFGRNVDFDLASKVTLYGREKEAEDWFGQTPDLDIPLLFRGGARFSIHAGPLESTVSGGGVVSDRTRPSAFLSGCVGISGSFSQNHSNGVRSDFGTYLARADVGAVSPSYIGDDGRYIPQSFVMHPVVQIRIPGLRVAGWYRGELYRLPLLPAVCRRVVHSASMDARVDFGLLSFGALLKPVLDFAEDGRVGFRITSVARTELSCFGLSFAGELQLVRSNEEPEKSGAKLAVTQRWRHGIVDTSVQVKDGLASVGTEITVIEGAWKLSAGVVFDGLMTVDLDRPSVALNGNPLDALGRGGVSFGWQAGY